MSNAANVFLKQSMKWCLYFLGGVALLLCLSLLLALFNKVMPHAGQSVHDFFTRYAFALLLWRLGLIALLILSWPWIVKLYANMTNLNSEYITKLVQARWRVAVLLLAFELCFGTDLLERGYQILWRMFS